MKVKVLRIKKLNSTNALKAFVDVSFDDILVVHGCQVFDGAKGLFAGLPSQKDKEGKYWPIVKINDDNLKSEFNTTLIEAYNNGSQAAADNGNQEVPF